MRNVWMLTAVVVLLVVSASVACAKGDETPIQYGEQAQNLLNAGKASEAEAVLRKGVAQFPDSDWLHSLYGRALFGLNRLDEAEDQFQQALKINSENPVARILIKEIRQTKEALKDQEMNQLINLGLDKAGDLGVIVLGVWLGTLMTLISGRLASRFSRSHFEKALRRQDWDTVTDILENLIANWKKRELRKNMDMMLSKMPEEEVERIIVNYVDVQQHEDDLLFFLRKMHAKRS